MPRALATVEPRTVDIGPPGMAATRHRPIRPCMVSFYFHPNYSGSAIQALSLSTHLQRLGMQPMIVSANLSGSSARESVGGVPVHRVPVAKHPDAQIPSFWLSAARLLWARRAEFDLIHAHGTVQHGTVSLLGRLLKKPTILKVAMADSDLAFSRQGRVFGRLNRFMVTRFDRYIATTEAIAEEYRSQGIASRDVRLIPNGVDTDTFAPVSRQRQAQLRAELGLPGGPLVSCVAVVNSRKNIDGLLRIWKEVVASGAPGHVLVIGPLADSAYFAHLRAFVASHALESRVSFLGERAPVAPYLQASDVFLFPSKREGMPNAVIEAMACGLPCVVSSTSGVAGLVHDGVSGYVVDPGEEQAFAARLLTLIGDEARSTRLGARARQEVLARFSLSAIASRYRELYEELVPFSGKGAGPR